MATKRTHKKPNKIPRSKSVSWKRSIKNYKKPQTTQIRSNPLPLPEDYFVKVMEIKDKAALNYLKYRIKLAVRNTKQRTEGSKNSKEKNDLTALFIYQLLVKQNFRCQLTNIPIIFADNSFYYSHRASIDRIDNDRGYCKDNVQLVCLPINYAKNRETNSIAKSFVEEIINCQKKNNIIVDMGIQLRGQSSGL